ncbi:aldo/keto reductase [Psychromarinibacter sp. C21-152]|uniref:Aldo/keto reductase n=1 Tax=Psychromarinibacter sediminicola TaxID=3033385 RepID=A0AAE3NVE0_9RHOB|nr:aldo/keto reductase [Psychromarinibacter sediminicola]MDF0602832.1 aldo/keto reductase [Psychromarinibacter sediminicola]
MKTRKLGTTEVSPLGIGAMSFGPFYGPTTEAASFAVLDAAMELGVTHIDTANVYAGGKSEETIGQFLAERPGAKDHFVIATKGAITKDDDGNRCFRNDAAHLEAELDKSLKRLGVDCVELYYIHRRQAEMPIEEAAEALASLVKKGKCRSIGFSEIAPSSLRRAAAVHPVAAVQSEYSLSVRAPELGLVQATEELGAALVAFGPVGRSFLTDRPIRPEQVEEIGGWVASNPRFEPENLRYNLEISDGFRKLAADMGEPAAAVAIAWLLAQGDHVIPIPGTRSADHFRELVRGAELELGEAELAAIETVLPVGWAHGDRYSAGQWVGPERYC